MSNYSDQGDPPADRADERSHLEGIGPGCGCAEVWERLSQRRADADSGDV